MPIRLRSDQAGAQQRQNQCCAAQFVGNDVAFGVDDGDGEHEGGQQRPEQSIGAGSGENTGSRRRRREREAESDLPDRSMGDVAQRVAFGGSTTTTGRLVPTSRLFILLRISSAMTCASTASLITVGRMNRISSVRARAVV